MKKLYFCIVISFLASTAQSQIITFTNANLKQHLLQAAPLPITLQRAKDGNGNYVKIDTNSNGEIEVSEALNIFWLSVNESNTDNLAGIEYFTNLHTFHCSYNPLLTSFGNALDAMPNLIHLIFTHSQINYYNTALHPGLISLTANNNFNLTSIDLTQLTSLQYCYLQENINLQSADFSACPNMQQVWLSDCNNLQTLNIKNGVNDTDNYQFSSDNLQYVCCDEVEFNTTAIHASNWGAVGCQVNSYCTITPGGVFYTINGNATVDIDNDGCDLSDSFYRNLKFTLSSATSYETYFGNDLGQHNFWVGAGNYTLTPILENPSYYTVSPPSTTANFPTVSSPAIRNFCILPNGTHPDLEIILIPVQGARPGFDCNYKIVYKNNGNITQSGTVNLTFISSILTVENLSPAATSQASGSISWDFTDLLPLESREIMVTLNLNSPMETPAVNIGDDLYYTCEIVSPATDETPANNYLELSQTVVGAYDPNDKTCLEGNMISPSEVGGYVHYVIRFENTGNFEAENVIVRDDIDTSKFLIGTLFPLSGSHPFITRIVGNKVEFIFENINLPFDDANNDGYIAFKIKTKPSLVLGDTFSNTASIYFDYNFPVVTDPAVTTVAILKTKDFEFSDYFTVYPNPVNDILHIQSKQNTQINSISIYNTLGQLLIVIPNAKNVSTVDASQLATGNYFIKINSDQGSSVAKFVKASSK